MNWSAAATLTDGVNTVTFNAASGDSYLIDPNASTGLDQAPIRNPTDDKPQTNGGLVFDRLKGPRRFTLAGLVYNQTGTLANRKTMESNLLTVCDNLLTADGTFTIDSRTLTVRIDIPCEFPSWAAGGFWKTFVFGLIAANPDF